MTKPRVKTSECRETHTNWMACRDCGIEFYVPQVTNCPERPGEIQARRFGFCSLEHVRRYVREIRAILRSAA